MKLLKLKIICCFIIIGATFGYAQGIMQLQPNDTLPSIVQDSLILVMDTIVEGDSIMNPPIKDDSLAMPMSVVVVTDSSDLPMMLEIREFQPNPTKAVIYAAIFPGLGQIYNRKYWKLPIVYGGFLGFSYAIAWNGRYYTDYSNGYQDIMDDDPETDSWKNFLPYGADPEMVDQAWLRDVMKRRKDFYRRYRDLSIIGTVAMYALSILDAYVDAQLFDFNISTDLSLRVEPTVIKRTDYLANSVGFQCRVSF
ncbi:MAG TPA: hypothetical protein GX746_07060 [Bacteroidales bacterium]|mgnify:FL=1|nr:hypothetical protein [Bacteroidales bacterium]